MHPEFVDDRSNHDVSVPRLGIGTHSQVECVAGVSRRRVGKRFALLPFGLEWMLIGEVNYEARVAGL